MDTTAYVNVSITASTNGKGLWSEKVATVTITHLSVEHYDDEDYGELRAWFSPKEWFIGTDGLIYTDKQWIKEFRKGLISLGLSADAAEDVDYSEQGMQGQKFVSMDVGEIFIKEWFTKIEVKEALTPGE